MVLVITEPNIAYDQAIGPIQCVSCPNCSRMFTVRDVKGDRYEVPTACRRCGSPMDEENAKAWAAAEALRNHDPSLAILGQRVRQVTADAKGD
jgi:hypothetical protein